MGPTTIRPLELVHTEHLLIGRKMNLLSMLNFLKSGEISSKLKKKKSLFIYLAAPGLSCSMWDLVP